MSVIPITLFFSLLLAGGFIVLFAREHRRRRFASAERDSLLPLADETPLLADPKHRDHAQPDHSGHGEPGCGCREGIRPPCPDCRHRPPDPSPASTLPLR